ncbi:MAG: hypothetical protein L7S45_06825 [Luminiphilus sp.]|nr:hypothetical protein [Luminiphilus sp.]
MHSYREPTPSRSIGRTDVCQADGIPVDGSAMHDQITLAIDSVVEKQIDAGVSIINDGEMSKPSYATYVQDRLSGFEGESVQNYFFEDLQDYPGSAEAVAGNPGRRKRKAPSCTSEIKVVNAQAAVDDMVALRSVLDTFNGDVSGLFSITPNQQGVKQEPPLPILVEVAAGKNPDNNQPASDIKRQIKERLLVTADVTLVGNNTLPRETYKSKLVDYSRAS